MAEPTTKLMISLIPPSDNPDALQTLLRSAFSVGCNTVTGLVVHSLFQAIIKGGAEKGS